MRTYLQDGDEASIIQPSHVTGETTGLFHFCVTMWLDGWMAGWLDGWMAGWLDGWMVGRILAAHRIGKP
jgi:hypothetical protein